MAHVPSITKEFLRVPVSVGGEAPSDTYEAEIAVVAVGSGEPVEEDWNEAEWDEASIAIIVGDGGIEIEDGYYNIWVRITTPDEIVVRRSGRLRVT